MSDNTHNNNSIISKVEAILFYNAIPMQIPRLAKILEITETQLNETINLLENQLVNRGIKLVRNSNFVSLVTSPDSAEIIEKIRKEELIKDLSKAALETLAIIIYRSPIKRADIDFIRGVNSQFTLRLLLIRGLIEKETNPNDERGYLYRPTIDLLNQLGVGKIEDVPDFELINREINDFSVNQKIDNE